MLQRPVPPGPGRDDDPGRAEEDWLAWCQAAEATGEPWDPDEEEPGEDAAPWDVDVDALVRDGTFRWTTPSGRTYTTEPTRYPI